MSGKRAKTESTPYYLAAEYLTNGRWHVDIRRGSLPGSVATLRGEIGDARRLAWTACQALNAAHAASKAPQLGDVDLEIHDEDILLWVDGSEECASLDRPRAAALGLALIHFAATGKLRGEDE